MSDHLNNDKNARVATGRVYAALAAGASPRSGGDLAQTPPPKGGLRPASSTGRDQKAAFGELLRAIATNRG